MLFVANYSGDMIADSLDNARRIFKKVDFAFRMLPKIIREQYIIHEQNNYSMTISLVTKPDERRTVSVSVSTRSATSNHLHISELGRIGAKYPEKEDEIRSGALESVGKNQKVTIESTAMGKQGLLYELVKNCLDSGNDPKSTLDWKLLFFPWYIHAEYRDDEPIAISEVLLKYFAGLEATGITLTMEQKYWYTRKYNTLKWLIKREYPSHILEAFEGIVEGGVYTDELSELVENGRYTRVEWDPALPVFTYWDIGFRDFNPILFVQGDANKVNIIDYYENQFKLFSHYVDVINKKKYTYGGHILPHDGRKTSQETGNTVKDALENLGLRNVEITEIRSIQEGLQASRALLRHTWIDNQNCSTLFDHMNAYRYQWNDRLQQYDEQPVHDLHSHAADGYRGLAMNLDLMLRREIPTETYATDAETSRYVQSHLSRISDLTGEV